MDVYETDPTYCGHATGGRTESIDVATKIPFVIYCSSKFRQAFPEKYDWLKSIKDEPFNTKDFMPLLMEICGLEVVQ